MWGPLVRSICIEVTAVLSFLQIAIDYICSTGTRDSGVTLNPTEKSEECHKTGPNDKLTHELRNNKIRM
jgi:hypothetical protein